MKERRKVSLKEAEVPMSAMIDVVFLLLIYFIVVQKPIIEHTLLKADLPAPGPPVIDLPDPVIVRIDVVKQRKNNGNNYYRMNGRWWNSDRMFKELGKISQNNPDTTVLINCGPNARHEKLITLLDACAEAELTNLNIVNDSSIKFKKSGY